MSGMPRSLILPVDTSEESPKVLQWALRNLLQPGDAVYLVRDGAAARAPRPGHAA